MYHAFGVMEDIFYDVFEKYVYRLLFLQFSDSFFTMYFLLPYSIDGQSIVLLSPTLPEGKKGTMEISPSICFFIHPSICSSRQNFVVSVNQEPLG